MEEARSNPLNLEVCRPAAAPRPLSAEQRQYLDDLCLCRVRGLGPHRVGARSPRLLAFFATCLAICVGMIAFPNRVPPVCGGLAAGFLVGVLTMGTRQWRDAQRRWPLVEAIIDWKLVDRLRQGVGSPGRVED